MRQENQSFLGLDSAVTKAKGRTLTKGPRGGGRTLDGIVRHVREGQLMYLEVLGAPYRDKTREVGAEREAVLAGLAASAHGELPTKGPRGGVRWKPRYFARHTGVRRNWRRKSCSVICARAGSGSSEPPTWNSGSLVKEARRFQGQTSWQMSHPNRLLPIFPCRSSAMSPRFSIVKYERQERASSRHPSCSSGTIASVGHASMQRVQLPQ